MLSGPGGNGIQYNCVLSEGSHAQINTHSFDWIWGVHGNTTPKIHLTSNLLAVWHCVCFLISCWQGQSSGDDACWYGGESLWVKVSSKLCQQRQSGTLKVRGNRARKLDSCHRPRGWKCKHIKVLVLILSSATIKVNIYDPSPVCWITDSWLKIVPKNVLCSCLTNSYSARLF